MKSLFILALCLTPLSAMAQGVWESPDAVAEQMKADSAQASMSRNVKDAKYLEGAVTEVDGRVEWRMDVSVPGKTAAQIYDAVFKCLTDMTKAEGQLEGSRVALRLRLGNGLCSATGCFRLTGQNCIIRSWRIAPTVI